MATEAITVRCSFHVLLCMQGRNLRERGDTMVCAFTGHRPEKLPWGSRETDPRCCALKIQLDRAVRAAWEAGATTFACGLARGCDFYFAEAVLRLQEQAEGISLEAWIPCPEQPNRWKETDKDGYRTLLTRCSRVHVVEPAYAPGCMLRRNRAMLQAADWLISVYDGSGGGTGAAVAYANRLGLPVEAIWL